MRTLQADLMDKLALNQLADQAGDGGLVQAGHVCQDCSGNGGILSQVVQNHREIDLAHQRLVTCLVAMFPLHRNDSFPDLNPSECGRRPPR